MNQLQLLRCCRWLGCLALCLFLVSTIAGCGGSTQDKGSLVHIDSGFSKFDALMAGISIFVLAVFVGFEVITKVPPTLHTPLMSGSNAISGITLVGALLVAGQKDYAAWLGVLAVIFATINVIGGFWVTHRMLSMFKR